MNDGRFDAYNDKRKRRSMIESIKNRLRKELKEAETVEDLKKIIEVLITRMD